MTESESVALPLGDAAIIYFVLFAARSALSTVFSISKEKRFVNTFFEKNSKNFKKLFCVSKNYTFGFFTLCFRANTCKFLHFVVKLKQR